MRGDWAFPSPPAPSPTLGRGEPIIHYCVPLPKGEGPYFTRLRPRAKTVCSQVLSLRMTTGFSFSSILHDVPQREPGNRIRPPLTLNFPADFPSIWTWNSPEENSATVTSVGRALVREKENTSGIGLIRSYHDAGVRLESQLTVSNESSPLRSDGGHHSYGLPRPPRGIVPLKGGLKIPNRIPSQGFSSIYFLMQ